MQSRIFYHCRKPNEFFHCEHCGDYSSVNNGRNPPIFTVGFEYDKDKNTLFIAWAKPNKGESYNKSFGVKTINNRLDRMISNFPNITYSYKTPIIVNQYIDFYIDRALNYFKGIDKNTIEYFV